MPGRSARRVRRAEAGLSESLPAAAATRASASRASATTASRACSMSRARSALRQRRSRQAWATACSTRDGAGVGGGLPVVDPGRHEAVEGGGVLAGEDEVHGVEAVGDGVEGHLGLAGPGPGPGGPPGVLDVGLALLLGAGHRSDSRWRRCGERGPRHRGPIFEHHRNPRPRRSPNPIASARRPPSGWWAEPTLCRFRSRRVGSAHLCRIVPVAHLFRMVGGAHPTKTARRWTGRSAVRVAKRRE